MLDDLVSERLKAKDVKVAFKLLKQVVRENPDNHWIRLNDEDADGRVIVRNTAVTANKSAA